MGDVCDNCPDYPNREQQDTDDDGEGDICDLCPEDPLPAEIDGDEDGRADVCDNCPETFNPDQADGDGDRVGDACDNCPENANADQADADENGLGDVCEDEACVPPECCEEFPRVCDDECYEACPEGEEPDPEDCTRCIPLDDVEPPIVSIQTPASGSAVEPGSTVLVTTFFRDDAETDSGIVSGDFSATGEAVASGATPDGFSTSPTGEITEQCSIGIKEDLSDIQDRSVTVTATGADAAGNQSIDAVTLVVSEEPESSLGVTLSGPTSLAIGAQGTWTATVTNGVGPYGYTFYWGGGEQSEFVSVSSASQTASHTYENKGTYEVRVQVIDEGRDEQTNSSVSVVEVTDAIEALPYTRCTIQIGVQGTFLYTPESGGDPHEFTHFWEVRWSAVGNCSGKTFSGILDHGDNLSGNLSLNIIDHPGQSGSEILGSFEASAIFKTDLRTTIFKTSGTYNGSEIWNGHIYVSGGEANNYINPVPKSYMKSEEYDWGTEELLSFSSDDRNYLSIICTDE